MSSETTQPAALEIARIRAELDAIAPLREFGHVTVLELARHFAVRAQQRSWRALSDDDSGLDPARIAAMCAEFAAAHALYALYAQTHHGPELELGVAPAFAERLNGCTPDEAAEQIRDAVCDGDGIGEWLFEHLGPDITDRIASLMAQLSAAVKAARPVSPAEADRPLPDGEWARVEILGHDSHTGWVTEATRAGQPVMVVRNWDGIVIAEIPGHSLYRFVPLPTPLSRPDPMPSRLEIESAWGDTDDYDYLEGGPI